MPPQHMKLIGNRSMNSLLETRLQTNLKPLPSAAKDAKAAFIRQKYVALAYADEQITCIEGMQTSACHA